MSFFSVKKLSKSFGGLQANHMIDLEVEEGEIRAGQENISIQSDLLENIVVSFDQQYMANAIDILLANAVKFSAPGGEIIVRTTKDENSLFLEVIDRGEGINADFLPYIFDEFCIRCQRDCHHWDVRAVSESG